eukprot:1077841-Alexandrium_andersonii.AAC.1
MACGCWAPRWQRLVGRPSRVAVSALVVPMRFLFPRAVAMLMYLPTCVATCTCSERSFQTNQ